MVAPLVLRNFFLNSDNDSDRGNTSTTMNDQSDRDSYREDFGNATVCQTEGRKAQ